MLFALGGCSDQASPPAYTGPSVEIAVAPLELEGVADACYRITVFNGQSQRVWQRGQVCADTFGDGSAAVSYVGPCDASEASNTVRLELEDLWADTDADTELIERDTYRNPCGHEDNGNDDGYGPCDYPFTCRENEDVRVDLNLTILRDAQQGFFDVAVDFDELFCSAKLDCAYGPNEPMMLLHDPDTGARGQTGVMALACTAGAGSTADTVLHMNPIEISCDGHDPITLDPTAGPGNAWWSSADDPAPTDPVWQYATYRGVEALSCGAVSCQKLYWNVAFGFDATAEDCAIKTSATASKKSRMVDGLTPDAAAYPWIDFDVALTADAAEGGLICGQNPLDEPSSGVTTDYARVDQQKRFCHSFDGVERVVPDGALCEIVGDTGAIVECPIRVAHADVVAPWALGAATSMTLDLTYDPTLLSLQGFVDAGCDADDCEVDAIPTALATGQSVTPTPAALGDWDSDGGGQLELSDTGQAAPLSDARYAPDGAVTGDPVVLRAQFVLLDDVTDCPPAVVTGSATASDGDGSSLAADLFDGAVHTDGRPIARAADRVASVQLDNGTWDWPFFGGDHAADGYGNILAPIARGVAAAYGVTGTPRLRESLRRAGAYLLTKTEFSPADGYLAVALDEALGTAIYSEHVQTNYYDALADGSYVRQGEAYDTAGLVSFIRDYRSGANANIAAWDIGVGLYAAKTLDDHLGGGQIALTPWRDGLEGALEGLTSPGSYDVIGLAGAVLGLASVGAVDYGPASGPHAAAADLAGLVDILEGYQLPAGGFTWTADALDPADGNETTQETAYAILALIEARRAGVETDADVIADGVDWLRDTQRSNGGWLIYAGGPENAEIDAEAIWALVEARL